VTSTDVDATSVGPLASKVMDFERIVKEIVVRAKDPAFGPDGWAPLGELVAVDEFERVGCWLEVMNWKEYTDFLTEWASATEFDTVFRRVSELPGLVFLELQERNAKGDQVSVVNSLTVYGFNDAGKIRHLDVYLQRPL
jgi:hypothetical protein